MERSMNVQEVILRAMVKKITWYQAESFRFVRFRNSVSSP